MKRLFLIFVLLLFACPAWGATYFVSQTGAGAKTGADVDNASAIATFNAGTAPYNVLDDDTVYLLDTITTAVTIPDGGTSGHVITVRGDYTGHSCTITKGAIASLRINGKSYVSVAGFDIANSSDDLYRSGILISGTTVHVSLDTINIDMSAGADVTRYALVSSGTASNLSISNVTSTSPYNAENIYIYGTGSTNVTLTNITATGGSESRFKNIENLTLTNYSQINALSISASIQIESTVTGIFRGDNIRVIGGEGMGITFNSSFSSGSYLKNSSVMSSTGQSYVFADTSNLTIDDSIAGTTAAPPTTTSGYGFYVTGATHNLVFNNNTSSYKANGGFWIKSSSYNIIHNGCIASFNHGDGFGTTDSAHDITYNNCTANNNGAISTTADGDGFTAHLTNYNINYNYCIAHNNTASGFAFGGNSSGTINNATVYANGGDWSGSGGVNQIRAGIFLPLEGNNSTTGKSWTVKNTISKDNYPREIYLTATSKGLVTMDYNLYKETTSSQFASIDGGVSNITWAQYHTSPNTYETHSLNSDPLFISTTNYHLQSGSPARGAGVNVGLVHLDPPDIGAEPYLQYVPWRH